MKRGAGTVVRTIAGIAAMALTLAGCRQSGMQSMTPTPPASERPTLLETVGEFAVVPLYADGFEELEPRQKALAYYLYRAALAGRDIFFDQMSRHGLEVRDLLEEIAMHPEHLPPEFLEPDTEYTVRVGGNRGLR